MGHRQSGSGCTASTTSFKVAQSLAQFCRNVSAFGRHADCIRRSGSGIDRRADRPCAVKQAGCRKSMRPSQLNLCALSPCPGRGVKSLIRRAVAPAANACGSCVSRSCWISDLTNGAPISRCHVKSGDTEQHPHGSIIDRHQPWLFRRANDFREFASGCKLPYLTAIPP